MIDRVKNQEIEINRKRLLKQQTELRQIMMAFDQHRAAMEIFLEQHASLHSANMSETVSWSFEDAILNDMDEAAIRRIPKNCEHSIAWNIWHIARIEDVAINLLVAGDPQIFHLENWSDQMGIPTIDTGNAMSQEDIAALSARVNIQALRDYRVVVGRKTQEIARGLAPEDLKQRVDPQRLAQVMAQGALVEAASGIRDYWGKRNIAGLLLMPATRHPLSHLNEALKLKRKR